MKTHCCFLLGCDKHPWPEATLQSNAEGVRAGTQAGTQAGTTGNSGQFLVLVLHGTHPAGFFYITQVNCSGWRSQRAISFHINHQSRKRPAAECGGTHSNQLQPLGTGNICEPARYISRIPGEPGLYRETFL